MKIKPALSVKTPGRRAHAKAEVEAFGDNQKHGVMMTELYRNAEAKLWKQKKDQKSNAENPKSEINGRRLFHELQVQQIELEMQNTELRETRDRMEILLEKYAGLYDFAPVGYLTLDEQGKIMEANLYGSTLLGVERFRLINQRLPSFVSLPSRPIFLAFLKRVFAGNGKQTCEATLQQRKNKKTFWACFHGSSAIAAIDKQKWCRVVISDITIFKQAEEAKNRADMTEVSNQELRNEIAQRKVVEKSLRKSEQHQNLVLAQSRQMQEQLKNLSRQVLHAQEEERKRISRELHDVIAQSLTGINLRLATLQKDARSSPKVFDRNITLTQQLVERSVNIVHEFARELRPAVLDDLGLIPALHSFMKKFTSQTGIHVHLKAVAEVDKLETSRRTVLFRIAQEALANVARHAQASRVEVSIQKLSEGICMKIKDDGKSFSADRVMNVSTGNRLGLLGMRERLEMVGGRFEIESVLGKGTTIIAEIPLAKATLKNL